MRSSKLICLFVTIFTWLSAIAQTPELVFQSGHFENITCLVFNSAGDQLVSSSEDKTIRVWDLKSRRLARIISHFTEEEIQAVCYGINDSILISLDNWNLIYFDIYSGEQERSIRLKDEDSYISGDHYILNPIRSGNLLITNYYDGDYGIEIRDLSTGEIIMKAPVHDNQLTGVGYYEKGNSIIYSYGDGTIFSYDIGKGSDAMFIELPAKADGIGAMRIRENNLYLFCGDGNLRIIDLESKKTTSTYGLIDNPDYFYRRNHPVDISSAGEFVYYDQDKNLNVSLVKISNTGSIRKDLDISSMLDYISTDLNGNLLAIADDNKIVIYGLSNVEMLYEFTQKTNWYDHLVLTEDPGIFYAIPIHSGLIYKGDMREGNVKLKDIPRVGSVYDIDFYPDRKEFAVSSGIDILFYHPDFNELVDSFRITDTYKSVMGHPIIQPGAYNVKYSHDGSELLTQDGNKCGIKLWDLASKTVISNIIVDKEDQIVEHLDYNSLLDLALVETSNNYFGNYITRLIDLKKGKIIWETNGNAESFFFPVSTKAFVPDGILDLNSFEVFQPDLIWEMNYTNANPQISANEKWICYNYQDTIKLLDVEKDETTIVGFHESMEGLRFANYQNQIFTFGKNGSIKIWDYLNRKMLAACLAEKRNSWDKYIEEDIPFLILNEDGYYMGAKSAGDLIAYRFGDQVYSFDQFDAYFNRPDLVMETMNYSDPKLINAYQLAYNKRILNQSLPDISQLPDAFNIKLEILNRREIPFRTGNGSIPVEFLAEDPENKLISYKVFVNGVSLNLPGSVLQKPENRINKKIKIQLSQGKNLIEIAVVNEHAVESLHEIIEVESTTASNYKDLYIVGIGVGEYQNSEFNLKYPVKDVTDFTTYYERSTQYRFINTLLMLDADFTKSNLVEIHNFLEDAQVNDQVIVFYAGHGLVDEEHNYYLATYDMDFSYPGQAGVPIDSIENILNKYDPRERIVLIDACHSGLLDKSVELSMISTVEKDTTLNATFRGANIITSVPEQKDAFELMQALFRNLNKGAGTNIISAAGGTQFAYESGMVNNGIFTWAFLKGIKSGDADRNNNGLISITEIKRFVEELVFEQSKGLQKPASRQLNYYNDFSIWNTKDTEYGLFHRAAGRDDTETLEIMLNEGVDVDIMDPENKFTALHIAARQGSNNAIHYLVQQGAETDRQSFMGWTPLHLAVHNNYYTSALLLLFYGADKNVRDNMDVTPTNKARENDSRELLHLLNNSEEIIEEMKKHREVFRAIGENDTVRIQKLFESQKLDINYIDPELQFSLLHVAVGGGNEESVGTLLLLGADPDLVIGEGFTPLMVATYYNHVQIAKILLQNGADKDKQSDNGETAYDLAIQLDKPEMIELLK